MPLPVLRDHGDDLQGYSPSVVEVVSRNVPHDRIQESDVRQSTQADAENKLSNSVVSLPSYPQGYRGSESRNAQGHRGSGRVLYRREASSRRKRIRRK